MTGWWPRATRLKKYEFVNWDDEIPIIDGKMKNVPNHQPDDLGIPPYFRRFLLLNGFMSLSGNIRYLQIRRDIIVFVKALFPIDFSFCRGWGVPPSFRHSII